MTSIQDSLSADHVRLDSIFEQLVHAAKAHDGAAHRLLDLVERELTHHMAWEERHLFPAVLALYGDRRKHVESLTIDHDFIRSHLAASRDLLAEERFAEALDELEALRVRLIGHNDDEELGAYRAIDLQLGEEERRALLEAFKTGAPARL